QQEGQRERTNRNEHTHRQGQPLEQERQHVLLVGPLGCQVRQVDACQAQAQPLDGGEQGHAPAAPPAAVQQRTQRAVDHQGNDEHHRQRALLTHQVAAEVVHQDGAATTQIDLYEEQDHTHAAEQQQLEQAEGARAARGACLQGEVFHGRSTVIKYIFKIKPSSCIYIISGQDL